MTATSNSLNAYRAAFWRVDLRTIQRWVARTPPLPVDDPAAMLAWVAAQPSVIHAKLSPSFRRRIAELRLEAARSPASTSVAGASTSPNAAPSHSPSHSSPPPSSGSHTPFPEDPDRTAFLASRATPSGTGAPSTLGTGPAAVDRAHDSAYLANLKLERDFAIYKLQRANTTNNLPVIKDTTEAITRLSGVIHDEELRAQKLGREIGDIIPRPDYERQLRALAYWLVRSVDAIESALAPALAARSATGPLYREEVRALLEPILLTTRVLEPLRRSADLPPGTGAALPPWALNALHAALAACIENPDAAEFSQISNPQISNPLGNAITGHAPVADSAPSVSEIPNTPTASAISSATTDVGSGATQTALKENK